MDDNNFKLEVVQRLMRIETLIEKFPVCEKYKIKEMIKINRKLIFLLFTILITLIGFQVSGG